MTAPLYLSHVRLRPNPAPADADMPPEPVYQALRQLFDDGTDGKREFLWRDDGEGRYVLLSQRQPSDGHSQLTLTSLALASLSNGDRFGFVLRANPVVTRKPAHTEPQLDKHGNRARGQKIDVIQQAMKSMPKGASLAQRAQATYDAGYAWLQAQGSKAGFTLTVPPVVVLYTPPHTAVAAPRVITFSELDFSGQLAVTDAATFAAKLVTGFGSAKTYGNGLMLLTPS